MSFSKIIPQDRNRFEPVFGLPGLDGSEKTTQDQIRGAAIDEIRYNPRF